MTETPIYDQIRKEMQFNSTPGVRFFTDENGPPEGESILMENVHGMQIFWSGKRWVEADQAVYSQNYDSWPPRDYDGPWREVPE